MFKLQLKMLGMFWGHSVGLIINTAYNVLVQKNTSHIAKSCTATFFGK